MRTEKGAALISVILVVFVLTMVGLAVMLFMNIEDTISGNDNRQKEALYLAEIGLRQGEQKIAATGTSQITSLLQYSNAHNQVPPSLSQCTGTSYLGTVLTDTSNQPLYMIKTTYSPGVTGVGAGFGYYSVYVRNNRQDPSGSVTIDHDGYVDLVSQGILLDANGNIQYQKILSEEFFLGSTGGAGGPTIGQNPGNTNALSY
jgi:Tfp pilus assembly protein PilX